MPASRPAHLLLGIVTRIVVLVIAVNLLAPLMLALMPRPSPYADQRAWTPDLARAIQKATIRYQTARDTLIDLLLPEGVGGTIVVAQVDEEHDGEAFPERAAIRLRAGAVLDSVVWQGTRRGDQVEMHERAHLLDANHPELVLALLRHLPPPDTAEYAATNGGEHFAEMVAQGWAILELQTVEGFCPDLVGAIRSEEERVPGTAGAVVWLAPTWQRVRGVPIDSLLHQEVDSLAAPYLDAWRPIAAAVDVRRLADGHFAAWPELDAGARLRRGRVLLLESPRLPSRVVGMMLWPAATVTRLVSHIQAPALRHDRQAARQAQ